MATWLRAGGLLLVASGCVPHQRRETAAVSYRLPNMSLLDINSHAQDKGGVVVEADPVAFKVRRDIRQVCRKTGGGAGEMLLAMGSQGSYELSKVPVYTVDENVSLLVKVTNRTEQVIKLDGTVLRARANDRDLTLHREQYARFIAGVLAPGEQHEYPIRSVDLQALNHQGTLHFGIYGLPTATDDAGNVVKRENFEWTFSTRVEERSEQVEHPVTVVTLNHQQAASQNCW